MSRSKKIGLLAIFALLIGGACWWLFGGESAQMQKVRQMQQEMMAAGKPPDRETMDNFRKEMDKLSSDEKMELGKGMFENMANQRRKEMDAYFAMSKEEREKFMDNRIKEGEKMRKQMAAGPGRPPAEPGDRRPVDSGDPGREDLIRIRCGNSARICCSAARRRIVPAFPLSCQTRSNAARQPVFLPSPACPPRSANCASAARRDSSDRTGPSDA